MSPTTVLPGLGLILTLAACGSSASQAPPPGPAPVSATASLYQRLGGYDALAAVTDEFLRRMLEDPALAPYFENLDGDGKKRVRQMVVDQLCAVTGGPCFYVGADMPTAHKGLGITEADWDKAVAHLIRTLDQLKVPSKAMTEVLEIVGSLKNEIVGK